MVMVCTALPIGIDKSSFGVRSPPAIVVRKTCDVESSGTADYINGGQNSRADAADDLLVGHTADLAVEAIPSVTAVPFIG